MPAVTFPLKKNGPVITHYNNNNLVSEKTIRCTRYHYPIRIFTRLVDACLFTNPFRQRVTSSENKVLFAKFGLLFVVSAFIPQSCSLLSGSTSLTSWRRRTLYSLYFSIRTTYDGPIFFSKYKLRG